MAIKKPLSQKKEALTNNFYFKTTKNNFVWQLKAGKADGIHQQSDGDDNIVANVLCYVCLNSSCSHLSRGLYLGRCRTMQLACAELPKGELSALRLQGSYYLVTSNTLICYFTTMFTMRPGTTITFTTCLPSRCFWACSELRAAS